MQFYVATSIHENMQRKALTAKKRSALRIAGGMNNDPTEIFPFFEKALRDFKQGVLMSGGTRCWTDQNVIQASVAEVVAHQGKLHSELITQGSYPMTPGFDENGNGDHTQANPETQQVVMIKDPSGKPSGWDGDVKAYIRYMAWLRDYYGYKAGVISWNGGGVTITETTLARDAGFYIYVITLTGRACDDQLSLAKFTGENVFHVSKNEPDKLHDLLVAHGF